MLQFVEGTSLLAYVFWHWKRDDVAASDYEYRQRGFHSALEASPSQGLVTSFSVGISKAPWAASSEAYEDWYVVQDFGSLGVLNEAAVSSSRAQPHDAAASVAAGGAGGVYRLKFGTVLRRPQYASWFAKPAGMLYRELFDQLAPVIDRANGALWMRQMVLGPAREFCLHTATPVSLDRHLGAMVLSLRPTWPEAPTH
jgi:hypothetical protein